MEDEEADLRRAIQLSMQGISTLFVVEELIQIIRVFLEANVLL
jgi:hypothetical protein